LAPALAALAGAGGIALWRLGRVHTAMRWALPATVIATAGWSVILLGRTPSFASWLTPLIIGGAALGAAGLWAGSQLRHRGMALAAAGVATAALLAGPTAYTLTTVAHASSGSLVAAGPTSSASGNPGGFGGGTGSADTALVSYLETHQGSAKYLVATFGSQSSAPIIIASGKPVVTIGGFNGGDPAPSLAQLKQMVAKGQLRYVLIQGNGGGFGGPGGNSSSAITSWVTSKGKEVTIASSSGAQTSGTLYDVSGAA
jgi:hypothetical protein